MTRDLPPTSAFANDDGAADPGVAACLARYASGSATVADVVGALAGTRVLVPILAVEEDGAREAPDADPTMTADRHASAGVVAVAAPDGRTALPVFTSVMTLARWHARARPMPAESARAAAAAVNEGWDLLVIDPGGPVTVLVPRPAVRALASGTTWAPAVVDGAVRPEVGAAVTAAIAHVPSVAAVDTVPGSRAEVAVVLAVPPGLSRPALDRLLADVAARLAADPATTAAVDSLELRVRTAGS